MEFEWTAAQWSGNDPSRKEIEESFEDPFSIRILPDLEEEAGREARYFSLGRAISGRGLFNVFWTDGKRYRVIFSRPMTDDEETFFDRKNSDLST